MVPPPVPSYNIVTLQLDVIVSYGLLSQANELQQRDTKLRRLAKESYINNQSGMPVHSEMRVARVRTSHDPKVVFSDDRSLKYERGL